MSAAVLASCVRSVVVRSVSFFLVLRDSFLAVACRLRRRSLYQCWSLALFYHHSNCCCSWRLRKGKCLTLLENSLCGVCCCDPRELEPRVFAAPQQALSWLRVAVTLQEVELRWSVAAAAVAVRCQMLAELALEPATAMEKITDCEAVITAVALPTHSRSC